MWEVEKQIHLKDIQDAFQLTNSQVCPKTHMFMSDSCEMQKQQKLLFLLKNVYSLIHLED